MDASLQDRLVVVSHYPLSPGWAKEPQQEESAGPYLTWTFHVFGIAPRPIGGCSHIMKLMDAHFVKLLFYIMRDSKNTTHTLLIGNPLEKNNMVTEASLLESLSIDAPEVELLFSSFPHLLCHRILQF